MNIRNHKVLFVSVILFALLLGGAFYLLFSFRSGYVEQKKTLQSKSGQLSNLNTRNPFPSSENLKLLQDNAATLEQFHQDLINTLSAGQVEPLSIESAQFPTLLNRTVHRLREKARANNIDIPEQFLFGFSLYGDGSLPSPANVERLTLQLQMTEKLLDVLYDSKIKHITEIERDVFETEKSPESAFEQDYLRGRSRTVSRRASPSGEPESTQYTKEPFTLKFATTDPALWDVLNKLSSNPMFIVTTYVEAKNPAVPDASLVPLYKGQAVQRGRRNPARRTGAVPGIPQPTNPFARSEAPIPESEFPGVEVKQMGPIASHEERIVAGRELVETLIKVDIYRVNRQVPENQENGGGE